MPSHIKKVQKPIRFHPADWEDVERAAWHLSQQTREPVAPSTLFREQGMARIRAILRRFQPQAKAS